jgi:hypothetical protein
MQVQYGSAGYMFRYIAVTVGYSCNKAQPNHVRRILQLLMTLTRIMMFLSKPHLCVVGKDADIVRVEMVVSGEAGDAGSDDVHDARSASEGLC